GPRVVHVVYRFARYVMIEKMRKLSKGSAIPFAEALLWKPKDIYIAKARHRVACNKLLQSLQREAFVIQEYKKKTR
ncbi:HAUS6 protein, partial [Spelaeornis formosus]|nr:HAUS6 protein [Elachura formosa]